MPHPRLAMSLPKPLVLLLFFWGLVYYTDQTYSQTPLTPIAADFVISSLPLVSEEAPVIHNNLVIWYDDRNGPTDIAAYDLTAQKSFALIAQPAAQFIADIHGDLVVYEDNRHGTWDIYGTQRNGQSEFMVTSGPHHQRYPRVWGDYVVYQDETADYAESNVYLYQISTGTTTPLAVAAGYQGRPDIDNQWVVWIDYRTGSPHLGSYNLQTHTYDFYAIGCEIYDCLPRLNGDEVVWGDQRTGDANIHLYHLASKIETTIYTGAGDQLYPDISPELIVWQDQTTSGNWDVFVYVRATQQVFPVTTEPSWQIRPSVAGNTVVWQDNRNHTWDIYGFTWRGTLPALPVAPLPNPRNLQAGAYSQGAIRLAWEDKSENEQGFRIERATGIMSTVWQELTTVPANTTVYTDTATTVGQSYWYRVQAVNGSDHSTYSNESYSTALDNVPNLDERYLHLLINELRMAPEVWQHPEYAALDPVGWHPNLAYSARAHALGMNNSNCCQGHIDLAGRSPSERAAASGYPYSAAENLFQAQSGRTGIEAAHQGFVASPGHLANMLDPATRQLAIGFAPGGRGSLVEVFSRGPADAIVPPLPSGIVVPYRGKVGTDFDFLVSFANPTQQAPDEATVVINDVAYPMTLRSGKPGRGTYLYRTRLPRGDYSYYFAFAWGTPRQSARLPEQGVFAGPTVHLPLPDLQVGHISVARTVVDHEQQVLVYLTNHGDIAANQISVDLYLGNPAQGGSLIRQTTLNPALPSNGTATIAIPWRPRTAGVQQLYAWVDSQQTIEEADETNNLGVTQADVRESMRIWHVDGAAPPGGDGLTPASALSAIDLALERAFMGDFVRVAAGVYSGTFTIPAGVHLAGAGYVQTTLRGNGQGHVVRMGDKSTISGFTITGSGPEYWDAGIWIDADRVATVRNNRITGNSMGIANVCFDPPCVSGSLLHNNIIEQQRLAGINIHNLQVTIVNNTVVGNKEWGIHVDVGGTVVKNNVIVDNKSIGLYAENNAIVAEYNNLWNNGTNHQGVDLGIGNLSVDPLWVGAAQGDYRLSNGSPCVDAGDPDPQYQDQDGSRNDLGALGGPNAVVTLPTLTPTPSPTVTPTPTLPANVTPTPMPTRSVGTGDVYLPLVRR